MLAKNFQRHDAAAGAAGTQFTCFTSTKSTNTDEEAGGARGAAGQGVEAGGGWAVTLKNMCRVMTGIEGYIFQVPNVLALLVQKYKY